MYEIYAFGTSSTSLSFRLFSMSPPPSAAERESEGLACGLPTSLSKCNKSISHKQFQFNTIHMSTQSHNLFDRR